MSNTARLIEWLQNRPKLWRVSSTDKLEKIDAPQNKKHLRLRALLKACHDSVRSSDCPRLECASTPPQKVLNNVSGQGYSQTTDIL